jgi:hypothetical protein
MPLGSAEYTDKHAEGEKYFPNFSVGLQVLLIELSNLGLGII